MPKELRNTISIVSKVFFGTVDTGCCESKPGKYDGWRCDDIPIKDWPYEK